MLQIKRLSVSSSSHISRVLPAFIVVEGEIGLSGLLGPDISLFSMAAFIPAVQASRFPSSIFVSRAPIRLRFKASPSGTDDRFTRGRPQYVPRIAIALRASATAKEEILEYPENPDMKLGAFFKDDAKSGTSIRDIVQGVLQLSAPLWNGKRKRIAYMWTVAMVVLSLAATSYAVLLSMIQRFFWNCLGSKDVSKYHRLLMLYIIAVTIGPFVLSLFSWVKARLALMWRSTLTTDLLDRYFSSLNYYKLSLSNSSIDNPDQRISEDVTSFTTRAVRFITIFGVAFFDLIVFSVLLFRIYAPLLYALIAYALIGSLLIAFIGRDLLRLNRQQITREADFRFGLVRIREATESIAFYAGEKSEKGELSIRFSSAFRNNVMLIGLSRNVEFVSSAFRYFAQVVPMAIIAPKYFAGAVKLGIMSQVYFSFNHVLSSLGLIVQEFSALSEFGAGVRRLQTLIEVMPQENELPDTTLTDKKVISHIQNSEDNCCIILKDLTVTTPSNPPRVLVKKVSVSVPEGERLLVVGQSGVGKSSLMRVVCGLWDSGEGFVQRPSAEQTLFLPQRPFIMLGSLRENVVYPSSRTDVSDDEVISALRTVNLGHLCDTIGDLHVSGEVLSRKLSLGEQQRLAFARLLISKPRVVILDESSSALDLSNERAMYNIVEELGLTCISVGNRPSLLNFHDRILQLEADGSWKIVGIDEARQFQQESLFV